MISFLEGILEEKHPAEIVLNVAGVGYDLAVTLNTYEDLPALGQRVRLFTHHHVREDAEALYGFSDRKEREFFRELINVSGIGPTLAMTVLSGLPLLSLCAAIAAADVKRLSTIKGIGKKTAERIIVELKDKISPYAIAEERSGAAAVTPEQQVLNDAVLALVALGYSNADAYASVKRVLGAAQGPLPVEDIVRRALGALQ